MQLVLFECSRRTLIFDYWRVAEKVMNTSKDYDSNRNPKSILHKYLISYTRK